MTPFPRASADTEGAPPALTRMRMIATGLLLLMAAIFLASRALVDRHPALGFVQAFSEAAMVGGLADWFAVTALFRRPLGLPIPHTAIVPRNKDRIGDNLGTFVERNFLAPELVASKLRSIDAAGHLGAWLAEPQHARTVAGRLTAAVPYILDSLQDAEVRRLLKQAIDRQLQALDLAPVLGKALAVLTEGRHHQAIFDQTVAFLGGFLAE